MTIIVCPLSYVDAVVAARKPSHLITLLDPNHFIETPDGVVGERHLRVGVHDICDVMDGYHRPEETDVEQLVAFGRAWDGADPILIHCWAGISRSTAAAFTLACERNPAVDERVIARRLREASRTATPNRRIVALADDLLGRRGRMVDAAQSIGVGDLSFEGRPFDLPVRY
jgi:predicted protein tyrosine phosphatase